MSGSNSMAQSDPLNEPLLLTLDDKYIPTGCRPISCNIFWIQLRQLMEKLRKMQEVAAYGQC